MADGHPAAERDAVADHARLLALLDGALADGLPRTLCFLHPGDPPPGANFLPRPRLSLVLTGCFAQELRDHAGVHIGHGFSAGEGWYAPAYGWNLASFARPFRTFGVVFHADCTRFLHTDCPGDGRRATPRCWYHTVLPPRPAIEHLLRALGTLADDPPRQDAGPALVRALLLLARRELAEDRPGAQRAGAGVWRHLRAYVIDHCHEPLGRSAVAGAFAIHPNHVSRLFQRHAGESFVAFLNRARLERAARLLRHDGASVAAIARRCGFASAGYFARVFRRAYGQAPAQFRAGR